MSAAMKKLVDFTCARCKEKFPPGALDVHHLSYDRLGNERPSDLQVLCRAKCHPVADAIRTEQTMARRAVRQNDAATQTFMSKKYGDNYASFADDGMYEEFDRWRARKHFGETGEEL